MKEETQAETEEGTATYAEMNADHKYRLSFRCSSLQTSGCTGSP